MDKIHSKILQPKERINGESKMEKRLSKVSYALFSDDATKLGVNRDNRKLLIFSPLVRKKLPLPEVFNFSITIGIHIISSMRDSLNCKIIDPENKVISTIDLYEMFLKKYEGTDKFEDESMYGNFSFATGNGLLIQFEGEYSLIVYQGNVEIGKTYLFIENENDDESMEGEEIE